jgi:hypothetical protein
MSGINEIKKKAKLSIDEMYDNQMVGKLDIQKTNNPDVQPSRQPDIQMAIRTTSNLDSQQSRHPANHPSFQETNNPDNQKAGKKPNQLTGHPDIQLDHKENIDPKKQSSLFPLAKQQQSQKTAIYKMTFNLTEDVYKAFNDLYANRMLEGRKTEKSEMICEAIEWLIKMESGQSK